MRVIFIARFQRINQHKDAALFPILKIFLGFLSKNQAIFNPASGCGGHFPTQLRLSPIVSDSLPFAAPFSHSRCEVTSILGYQLAASR
tara:strand:+ start:241 stop:504 length:264 start_codon:yes stop_codon:yes gene_type:complete